MRSFDLWERINLIALLALLGIPALLLIEILLVKKLFPLLVPLNICIISLSALFLVRHQRPLPKVSSPTTPLFLVLAVQLTVIIIIFSAYLALPDVDSYHWIKIYQHSFLAASPTQLPQRPLFHSLIYSLDQIPSLKASAVFKYVIPLLSLATLVPAWLVARGYPHKYQRVLLLLTFAVSPSLILHTQIATPQAILLILTTFFVFLLIYAYLTKNKFWHYLAGALIAVTALYHGLALLLLAAWLTATAWHHSKRYYILLLLLPVVFIAAPYLKAYLPQVRSEVRPNLTFPVAFTTIDGVPNGWPGLAGISQYYAFYLGLTTPFITAASVYYYFMHKSFRLHTHNLFTSASTLTLLLVFLAFFLVAEILPRFFNIVILADRAWMFVSLAAVVLFLPLFQLHLTKNKLFFSLLILFFITNIAGALYINNLKKHLLPDYAVNAAAWINTNLPAPSAIMLNRKPEYIDLYTASPLISLPADFYCREPNDMINFSRQQSASYLLFLMPSISSPYRQRPWQEPLDVRCSQPTPNNYPQQFQQIYNDAGQAIIWKII